MQIGVSLYNLWIRVGIFHWRYGCVVFLF